MKKLFEIIQEAEKDQERLKERAEHLQQRASAINSEIKEVKKKIGDLHDKLRTYRYRVGKRKEVEANGVFVSDHAIVRFCERVLGLDVEQVKKDILDGGIGAMLEGVDYADGEYSCKSHSIVFKDCTVITVKT